MAEEPKTSNSNIEGRLWLWQPILLFAFIGLIIFVNVSDSVYTNNELSVLKAKQPITKVEIKIGSDSPVTYITILDSRLLDSINVAFQNAQEKDIKNGGAFETWADMTIYKSNKKVNVFIQHSIYNGWMIDVGKTLTSDYLFSLIKRYSKRSHEKKAAQIELGAKIKVNKDEIADWMCKNFNNQLYFLFSSFII